MAPRETRQTRPGYPEDYLSDYGSDSVRARDGSSDCSCVDVDVREPRYEPYGYESVTVSVCNSLVYLTCYTCVKMSVNPPLNYLWCDACVVMAVYYPIY